MVNSLDRSRCQQPFNVRLSVSSRTGDHLFNGDDQVDVTIELPLKRERKGNDHAGERVFHR